MSFRRTGALPFDARPLRMVAAAWRAANVPLSLVMRISLKVFHWPQLGHFPTHLGDSCPQFSHTYAVLSLAIIFILYGCKDNKNKAKMHDIFCCFCKK
jgi:hypothetical protein